MNLAFRSFLLLAGACSIGVRASQHPLLPNQGRVEPARSGNSYDPYEPYDAGLFTPVSDLRSISDSAYTTLTHPQFPKHSVRIKESQFCDGTVRSYTGYIDVEARHLFFYFFESRRDPDADDVIFWTNGGPGGSSAFGLFMELGPCRVTSPNTTERFEYAWNDNANVFFVDQPVGVGFSYADHGEQVSTTADAAVDIASFVAIFFEHFPKFKGRPFHMAGESYGGRYIPVFASTVYDQNARLIDAGLTPINLTSIMIGNGCTDMLGMAQSYYDVQCEGHGFPFMTSISECVRLKQLYPRCAQRLQKSCKDTVDDIDCRSAFEFCEDAFTGLFQKVNAYDASRPCADTPGDFVACYPELKYVQDYLNNVHIQSLLGVDPAAVNYTWANMELNSRFDGHSDYWSFQAEHHVAALLERGVRALIYVGATDWICNWVGNERMTLGLEWTGQDAYRSEHLREWLVDGEVAGKVRTGGGLTFATIDGAGHMVRLFPIGCFGTIF
ncbi:Carboxypeptidase Y -like protein [Trametes pubescens]|uniref:Carboxypeptidase n=1 Tax=Trametes pubescens TaxID=154538 RepID=A0A1M2V6H8_TRAPU|nr:Carboxypeptidase Y -like protein [Trametes pubescens]